MMIRRPTLRRTLATVVWLVLLAQTSGPTYAALRIDFPSAAHGAHGGGEGHHDPEHHPGCPWEGTGECPHMNRGEGARLVQCGDDDPLAADRGRAAYPIAIDRPWVSKPPIAFELARSPSSHPDRDDPDYLLDAPPPRTRSA